MELQSNLRDKNPGESWRQYMSGKKAKLSHQFEEGVPNNVDTPEYKIFNNVAIYVNGYTTPSSSELRQIMMLNGGKYHVYYNSKTTTHIIATNLPNSKINALKNEKVVKPEWIMDSIKAGKKLSEEPYYLYKNNLPSSQRCLNFFPTTYNDLVKEHNNDVNSSDDEKQEMTKNLTENKTTMLNPGDDGFIGEFYNKSRLHHLSTMSLEMKKLVKDIQTNFDGSIPGKQELQKWVENSRQVKESIASHLKNTDESVFLQNANKAVIMHIDLDCFFVSVGLKKYPHLKGKPVVVTHAKVSNSNKLITGNETQSMSEIACCSYEARQFGIRNGMLLGKAQEICDHLVGIPYDFESYKDISKSFYRIVASYTTVIEAVSCDELYIDATSLLADTGATPEEFADCLRNDVKKVTDCTCSVGIGNNFLMARLATKKAKPNGVFNLLNVDNREFIKSQHVKDLPGIGKSMEDRLKDLSVENCDDLQNITLSDLQKHFGMKHGQTLYNICRGIDLREIRKENKRSSVSSEINYGIRLHNFSEATAFLDNLSKEIESRLKAANCRGRTITLKLKIRKPEASKETAKYMGHGLCNNMSRSVTIEAPTNNATVIAKHINYLFKETKIVLTDIRGIGIQVTKLVDNDLQESVASTYTLENYLKYSAQETTPLPQFDSPNKSVFQHSPKRSPTPKKSPRRGSPKGTVPYRYRTINEHFFSFSNAPNTKDDQLEPIASSPLNLIDKDLPFQMHMSIQEVKLQLMSWISNQENPIEEDITKVINFLQILAVQCQLEKCDLILKIIERLIAQKNTKSWENAYLKIREHAQIIVKRFYGGHLNNLKC